MANCNLLLTSGDRYLQTSGDLLTLTSSCSVADNPTQFATFREHTSLEYREHSTAHFRERTSADYRE